MIEMNSTRLIQVVRAGVCRRFFRPAMILCLLSGVVGFGYFYENELKVSAARKPAGGPVAAVAVGASLRGFPRQSNRSESGPIWQVRESSSVKNSSAVRDGRQLELTAVADPRSTLLSLNEVELRKLLRGAPMELTRAATQTQFVITLPLPDGTFAKFRVEESPVMAAPLASNFPATKTYRGRGLDDQTATTRFDLTPAGFHAIVLTSAGTFIIEPAEHGRPGAYVSYDQRDALQKGGSFSCLLLGAEQASAQPLRQLSRKSTANLGVFSGSTMLTYRLALAATAEFTQTYGGGTVGGALSAMTTMVNAVNAIYERDLGIHLMLVANETSIIFTNPATDGYTSDEVTPMLTQNQAVLDQRIGTANYDLGMVMDGRAFTFQPGKFIFQGAANFQSACTSGRKGTAATILRSTAPSTTSAIWVVAHELGHLLGALHTFNSTLDDCGTSRFAQVAYEPGSGSTIMGYRGGVLPDGTYFPLCFGDDLLSTDTYFHTASIEQIFAFTTLGSGSNCPVPTDTQNAPPSVDAGSDYTIPANTPFTLTATASDREADELTYCWEEFDLGAPGPPHTDNGNRPIFRSFAPVPYPTRTFPRLSEILSGTSTFGESLPTTNRTMTFRVTVRDNHPGGGGINTGAMHVNVVSSSGPFVVTQPGSSTSWLAGSNQTVTWNVANTSSAPVSCSNVRVLLSIDGGSSFPFTLASSTPNSGSATISVPNTPTSSARVKVEAVDNIFFSISLPNFAITPSSNGAPTLLTEANTNRALALDSITFVRDPFSLAAAVNFGSDQRTRVVLFALGLELLPGEDISVVTAQAEDSAHRIYPLTVESLGKVSSFDWFSQVNVRLPDGLAGAGEVLVSVSLRGAVSNKVILGIR